MIIGIDPGHGMSNRRHGVYDPGAVYINDENEKIEEARIALAIGLELREQAQMRGWRTWMSRSTNTSDAPLRDRVLRARAAQCDVLVSIHCNAHTTDAANGIETLYLSSEWVAAEIQRQLVAVLELRDRGIKQRDDLAILRYERLAVLCEVGFISNAKDRSVIINPTRQLAAARAIIDSLDRTVRL